MPTAILRATSTTVSLSLSDRTLAVLFILVGTALVYVVMFDQGGILAALLGAAAAQQNYLHEFFHDGRHLAGVPCH